MQTAIGQGNTLVSPMHMALITSAIANGGELMKPYLIDSVVSSDGETVKTTEPESYKRLMTTNEANILGKLMKGVVENGTASALNGRGYTVAGKTGSAEFDTVFHHFLHNAVQEHCLCLFPRYRLHPDRHHNPYSEQSEEL